ncbi:DUF1836 domain-containing protein [Metabacillus litoralis]|uniref:DUF1836 domain-containing protein n=1 Tax=Metabacillus litoralis TaxID=152268 RepID=UPI001CFE92DE|nr:DUF1836 domain-containing protein [Metabacillus litoralis]
MTIQLTRIQMSKLLYSLKGDSNHSPYSIVEDAINIPLNFHDEIPNFIMKANKKRNNMELGLSTNEIVALANLCELTALKSTSLQNWIKRDVKELIGSPELGKKYSIDQAAMLLIVKDLKNSFDFEKIRNVLTVVFNTLSDRSDDLISPISFYELYAKVLSSLDVLPSLTMGGDPTLKHIIIQKIDALSKPLNDLSDLQWETIKSVLVISVLSVLASHLHTLAQIHLSENI